MNRFGLGDNDAVQSIEILSHMLKEQYMLFGNILNVHWNIEGSNFIALHKLLEEHYEFVKDCCDAIAERIRVFGVKAPAHQRKNIEDSSISEISEYNGVNDFIGDLAMNYEKVICLLREAISHLRESKDYGTKSFLEDQILSYEKIHWELISNRE